MGTTAGTRALTAGLYLTDDAATLVYVRSLSKDGEVVIEDARTDKVMCVQADALDGWRIVTPEVSDA